MEWIFLMIAFIGIIIYYIMDRYFEYKEKQIKEENNDNS